MLLPCCDSYQKIKFGEAGRRIHIHPSSSLFQTPPKWVLYYELVATQKDYMRQVMEIQSQWLVEAAPTCYTKAELEKLDSKKKMPKNHAGSSSSSSKF